MAPRLLGQDLKALVVLAGLETALRRVLPTEPDYKLQQNAYCGEEGARRDRSPLLIRLAAQVRVVGTAIDFALVVAFVIWVELVQPLAVEVGPACCRVIVRVREAVVHHLVVRVIVLLVPAIVVKGTMSIVISSVGHAAPSGPETGGLVSDRFSSASLNLSISTFFRANVDGTRGPSLGACLPGSVDGVTVVNGFLNYIV